MHWTKKFIFVEYKVQERLTHVFKLKEIGTNKLFYKKYYLIYFLEYLL